MQHPRDPGQASKTDAPDSMGHTPGVPSSAASVRRALPPAALIVAIAAACSSGSNASPNKTPGQCVLSSGEWYCGTGYGDFPDCRATEGSCAGDEDAGTCFSCLYDDTAGASAVAPPRMLVA
jgi:hypothetical protein